MKKMKIKKRRLWLIIVSAVVAVAGVVILGSVIWYKQMLRPVNAGARQKISVEIASGDTAQGIAKKLEDKKIIRSAFAMTIYLKLNNVTGTFNKGVYSFTQDQDVASVLKHLLGGKPDRRSVLFYPGATLRDKTSTPATQKTDVASALKRAGYNDEQITTAFAATYTGTVLKSKPATADLEGYIYGDTYFLPSDATAQQALQRAISELDRVVTENNLEKKFAARGLSLYQGLTLASIVQRESIGCPGKTTCEDMRRIASVFYNRLKKDMPLGSDVTYHYAADKAGVARSHTLNSPYNTRIHKGLPPGPIASPGLAALNAAADPAQEDYLYFLSGDDNVTYFAKTEAEHKANITAHCAKKCQLP